MLTFGQKKKEKKIQAIALLSMLPIITIGYGNLAQFRCFRFAVLNSHSIYLIENPLCYLDRLRCLTRHFCRHLHKQKKKLTFVIY